MKPLSAPTASLLSVLVLSAALGSAHAESDGLPVAAMRDDEALANAQSTDNGKVQFISGGVAVSGMRAIDAEERAYRLKLLFVANGEYLAAVKVNITDSRGNSILDTTTTGPVLLVKMASGPYTVSTTTATGSMLTQKVVVGPDHLAAYVLRYPPAEQ